MRILLATAILAAVLPHGAWAETAPATDSLPPLVDGKIPTNVDELWGNYDPTKEPLETRVVREWKEGNITIRHVVFTISTFKGQKSRLATFYAFPKSDKKLLAFCRFTEAAAGPRPTAGLQGEDAEGKLVFEKLEDWTKRPE